MVAPVGNKFWEVRSSHGRKPIFAAPGDIWAAAVEYFTWADANPLMEEKTASSDGHAHTIEVSKMRAMSLGALCTFLDISRQAWMEYTKREGFGDVTAAITAVIFAQKFEGAAAGLLNGNIIARDLGLADKQALVGDADSPPVGVDMKVTGLNLLPLTANGS